MGKASTYTRGGTFGALFFWTPLTALLLFGILPFLVVAVQSVTELDINGRWSTSMSLDAYRELAASYRLAMFSQVVVRSVLVATIDTVIALPIAFALFRLLGPSTRMICLALFTLPFLSSDATRAFGWTTVLGRHGLVNEILMGLGICRVPLGGLIYGEAPVNLALVSGSLSFAVFIVSGSLATFPSNVWRVSRDFGISCGTELVNIVIPIAAPAILLAWITCFVVTVGSTCEVAALGGPHQVSLGGIIDGLESARRITAVFALCSMAGSAILLAIGTVPLVTKVSSMVTHSSTQRRVE
jgi:putative spermidine/putrescine transport system permease protein